VELLCRQPELSPADQEPFRQLCRLLDATLHFGYHARLEELKDAYAPFDPDADTRPLVVRDAAGEKEQIEKLFDRFIDLLERANFIRLTRAHVAEALKSASDWGLNLVVDFNVFDRLEIFARGDMLGKRTRRNWRTWFRTEEVPVPVYQRLVLMLRLRNWQQIGEVVDTRSVYIKVFKEIPKLDLEMLLPGTRVQLSRFDQGRILLPTLSGVAVTIWKLVQGAATLVFNGINSSMAFLGLIGGTVGYGLRSFYGYLQTKQKYQLNLTQSLYFQNLDNNAGALFLLLNEAEEQEFREAALAYFVLLTRAGETGWTRRQVDDSIEELLKQAAGIEIDFEISDAVDKLVRYRLVEECGAGKLRAVPLRAGLEALDRAWDGAFEYHRPAAVSPATGARAA
jgi:hypothetical protein